MSKPGRSFGVAILFAWIGWASPGLAADAVGPTLTISREDVVQDGSPLFSVESALGKAELASHQIKDRDEIDAGAKATRLAFNGAENTVESFHKRVG